MEKRWNIVQAEAAKVESLQTALRINEVLCRILVQRGITTFDAAKAVFRPNLSDLHDPWLMKDMDKAVERILHALGREKILVYGDYDVDGTTAVACLYQFLRAHSDPALIHFYFPHRYGRGPVVARAGIDYAHAGGFSLIISLDCGIKSVDLIDYAAGLGIDFIV